jgi:hypothetical protein
MCTGHRRRTGTYLGCEDLHAGVLDVPAELVDGPAGAAEGVAVAGKVLEVAPFLRRLVQPRRRPQELVLHQTMDDIEGLCSVFAASDGHTSFSGDLPRIR